MWQKAKERQRDTEGFSNALDKSGRLQLADKQDTPSGTRQRSPREVNDQQEEKGREQRKDKNVSKMTPQGSKHPDRTRQGDNVHLTSRPVSRPQGFCVDSESADLHLCVTLHHNRYQVSPG